MSEATPEGGSTSGETPAAEEFQPITSQDELNKLIGRTRDEERRKASNKFADYNDLKAKAVEFDRLQAANQTEAEKAAARMAELETELNNTRAESMRLRIAGEHGITDADDIALFLTGNDEETLTRQAQRLAARTAEAGAPRAPKPDANQGRAGTAGPKSTADSFAEFFRQNLPESR